MSRRRTVRVESAAIARLLGEPWLWLLVAAMLAGAAGAYRLPYHFLLDIGGGPSRGAYDAPYLLGGFNDDPEPDPATTPPGAFRWVFDAARLTFPGLGRAVYAVTLQVVTSRPEVEPVPSSWQVDGAPLNVVPLQPGPRSYHLLLPSAGPDLDLRISTPPFRAPGDPRALAFGADLLRLAPISPAMPAWPVLGWLAGSIGLAYLLLRRAGLRPSLVAGVGLALVLVLVWWLAFYRLSLASFAPRLWGVLLAALAVSLVLEPALGSLATALGIVFSAGELRAITGLVLLGWIIRLGGLLHPQAFTSDLGLHMHNLEGVIRGEVIFTENLPSRAGGGPAPYPPAQYVMLAPWHLLADSRLVTRAGNTLADSLVIVVLWLLSRTAGAPPAAALFAGGLYLFATPLLISLSIGEMANVWGQALAGPVALLIQRWRQARPAARPDLALGVGVTIGLLGHFGVFLSLLIFLGIYTLLLLLLRGPWLRFAAIAGLALVSAVVLYYSAFVATMAGRAGASVPFGWERLRAELAGSFGPLGPIGPLLGLLGLAGLAMLLREPRARAAVALGPLLAAWCASALVSVGSLLWTRQALRWEAFLFPGLALCAGIALAGLHRRGAPGRSAAYALLALACLRGALLWFWQIVYYR